MFQTRAGTVLLPAIMLITAACGDGRPVSPASPSSPTSPPTAPPTTATPPNHSLRVFEITAVVTDDRGAPVPGARVVIFNDYAEWPVHTDNTGRYTLNFNAIGSIHSPGRDPAGTENAVAFAYVEAAGYHWHSRFVLGTSQRLVENIRLRRPPQPLTPGESASLTIGPDDTVCGTERWIAADGRWPGRESICQNLSVVAPEGGIMNVEAVPIQPGATHPGLEVSVPVASVWGNPISVQVAAGQEYQVRIAVPWGSNQSFVVTTSMQ